MARCGMMSRMNREWHLAHVLGSNAPMDRRVEWHLEHARVCGCREIPPRVRAAIEARGLTIPGREPGPPAGPVSVDQA